MSINTIHTASFSQPGPELNPLGVKISAIVEIELFQAKPNVWNARERTMQRILKQVQPTIYIFQARQRTASLFMRQETGWNVDGIEDPSSATRFYHLHETPSLPSLCGSRFHQKNGDGLRVVIVPDIRTGGTIETPVGDICPVCRSLLSRTPAAGDRVTEKISGRNGVIFGLPETTGKASSKYVIRFVNGETEKLTAPEFRLHLSDVLPQL